MVQILIFLWLAGTIIRIWRLARFFQLEGYDSRRYLRWLAGKAQRLIVLRAAIFVGVALVTSIALNLAGEDTATVYLLIWGAAGVLAVWPDRPKEVKQKFKLTQRAARLLVTAFALAVIALIGTEVTLSAALNMNSRTQFAVITLVGLAIFHLAALALPLANLIMHPVEAAFRRVFVDRARRKLEQLNARVIGITGSYGKTSTKTYLAHLLSGRYSVAVTPKSYNTLMGVCLVINNELDPAQKYDFFIVEMGAYVEGEIRRICELTRPQISIVSAVGPQHLERFGSLEATARAKYEIIQALPQDGVGVFNWDDHYVRSMYEHGYPDQRIAVTWKNADHATQLRLLGQNVQQSVSGLEFDITDTVTAEKAHIVTRLIGEHNVTNILLAAAVARHLEIPLAEIALRAASLEPAEHRLQRRTLANNITIIDDAYSANPVGARSALEVLALYTGGRRILITPGMVELCPLHHEENLKLGRQAAQVCTDIVLVGIEQTRSIQQGVRDAGFDTDHLIVYDTRDEAIAWFQKRLVENDTVLFLNDLPDTYL